MDTVSSTGKTGASIEDTTREEPGRVTESSTMEKPKASAEEFGGGECWKEKEFTNSPEELPTEWFGGRAKSKPFVDDIHFIGCSLTEPRLLISYKSAGHWS
jgi:hypothetical protein